MPTAAAADEHERVVPLARLGDDGAHGLEHHPVGRRLDQAVEPPERRGRGRRRPFLARLTQHFLGRGDVRRIAEGRRPGELGRERGRLGLHRLQPLDVLLELAQRALGIVHHLLREQRLELRGADTPRPASAATAALTFARHASTCWATVAEISERKSSNSDGARPTERRRRPLPRRRA